VEVELLSQLSERLLGLRGLRPALLQIAPRWMLEWWVGTLPLNSLVQVWDSLLANARPAGDPSVLNLQLSLVLIQTRRSELSRLDGDNPAQLQQAFELLQEVCFPSGDDCWLMRSAQGIQLHDGTVQEMRLQIRMSILHRCNAGGELMPSAEPLPRVCAHLPMLKHAPKGEQRAHPAGCAGWRRHGGVAAALHSLAGLVLVSLLVGATLFLAMPFEPQHSQLSRRAYDQWAILRVDAVVVTALLSCACVAAWRWPRLRHAVALCIMLAAGYSGFKIVSAQLLFTDNDEERGVWRWWPLSLTILLACSACLLLGAALAARARRARRSAYGELSEISSV
jgi:hypothetical protein